MTYLRKRSYAMLSGLAAADALVVRTINTPSAAIGEHVAVIRSILLPVSEAGGGIGSSWPGSRSGRQKLPRRVVMALVSR